MGSEQSDYTIRVPKRAMRNLGIGFLAVMLVGTGVGAGLVLSGDEASVQAGGARDERSRVTTTSRPEDATTSTTVLAQGSGGGYGGGSDRGDATGAGVPEAAAPEAAAPEAAAPEAPPPVPAPDASLSITATTLPVNCGTPVPTFSVRWSTADATKMEIALGGGGFGPAPLNGSRLYPLPCAGGVSVCGRATNAAGAVTVRCTSASF